MPPGAPPDLAPLIALFNATDGDYWGNNNLWLSDEPLHDWKGITTNEEGRVTRINLPSNLLNGQLPPELSQLEYLEHLDLNNNQLTGNIPQSLGQLPNLMHLDLNNNQLSGIPQSLADLPKLTHLDLSSNLLSGPIPSRIGMIQPLANVNLSYNSLSGEIPASLVASPSLSNLSLVYNQLTGGIPREFHSKSQLKHINLAHNQLSFEIPFEIERLRRLQGLYLNNNKLTNHIPPNFRKLSQLEWIDLRHNQLTGPIPIELSQMDELKYLLLDNNLLSGTIPSELANIRGLMFLGVSDNHFTGCIPTELRKIGGGNIIYANVTYCDQPLRSEPYSPPYVEWVIGDSVTPSQELAARLGVERIAKFIEKVGWPAPSETITVHFGDSEAITRSYANQYQIHGCDITCARNFWMWRIDHASRREVFVKAWQTSVGSLDEQTWRVAQQTVIAIHNDWLANFDPLDTTRHPSWWVYGLPTLIEKLAEADQQSLTYEANLTSLRGRAFSNYKPLSALEEYDRHCTHYCGAMAIEILASQVGLRTLANYYIKRVPGTAWQQTFEDTFNVTVSDFYDLYKEHYNQRFPYLELPIEGSTQWPWHRTDAE